MNQEQEPTAKPLLKPRLEYFLVDTDLKLEQLLAVLKKNSSPIAIDAERASGFRYGQKVYLIQIAIKGQAIYLIDPIANLDSNLLDELKSSINSFTWIIHAATQDLECLNEFGLVPKKLFDTELAGRLLGLPKVSLGTMCESLLGLSLAKEHSAVDWSSRPLPEEWLNYAALDVDVLDELWLKVKVELEKANKHYLAIEEFEFLTLPTTRTPKLERWRSTTGVHEIKDARQLTIVKWMWEAREELAKQKDVAPSRLIPDLSIIAAVKAMPKSKSELAELRSFSGRASRTYIDTWWDTFQKGSLTHDLVELRPKAIGIPHHRNWPNKFPEANLRLTWAKKLLQELSLNTSIPVENLLTPDILKSICFEPNGFDRTEISSDLEQRGARKWQIDLVSPILAEAFSKTDLPESEETKN